MASPANQPIEPRGEAVLLADFLQSTPPGQVIIVSDLGRAFDSPTGVYHRLRTPDLQLHCPGETCNGLRFFRCSADGDVVSSDWRNSYLTYQCSNCQRQRKVFSLITKLEDNTRGPTIPGQAYKFGEIPTFGPPTPAKLMSLIGPDREDFLKGRCCENQGLGVGALAYYRRVVENQKNRIIGEMIKVAEKVGAGAGAIAQLNAAVSETQFPKALCLVKSGIPESLLVDGHNPIALLHTALRDAPNGRSDEKCLEVATSVRVVLADLSERIAQALKDEAELSKALSMLLNRE